MKLLVCVSQTPDTTAKISFTPDHKQYDSNGVQFIMNPYDEWYALVRAIELKESIGGSVTIVNVGPASNETVIRKGLAIGADNAVRIEAEPTSGDQVAAMIAQYAKDEAYDIVFTGKETIDYNGSEVGAMIAEHLAMPFLSYASKLDLEGNTATVEVDVEGGVEILSVNTPFVISAAKGMAEQRIPNMRGIMMARTKPLDVIQVPMPAPKSVVAAYTTPPPKGSVKLIDPENMDELVRLLAEEAKVI